MAACMASTLLLFIFVEIGLRLFRKSTIRFFFEWDFIPISGGLSKNFVGGVITILYGITMTLLISGVLVNYFMHNELIEATQLSAFEHKSDIESSYEVKLDLYVSQYSESPLNLCEPQQVDLKLNYSTHFTDNQLKVKCSRQLFDPLKKTAGTKRSKAQAYVYEIRILCDSCSRRDPTGSYLGIDIQEKGDISMQSFFVHFFKWRFNSVWGDEAENYQEAEARSEVGGFATPDPAEGKNLTNIFRGSEPNVMHLLLTPTFYQNTLTERELSGYRAHF